MRNQGKDKGRNSSKKAKRVIAVAIVMVVVALGAMAAVSLRSHAKDKNAQQAGTPANLGTNNQPAPFVRQSAQIRPLTQEEAQKLAEGLKKLVNQSTDGLQQVQHADGSVSMDLQGRFQSLAVAKRDENGNVVQSCVDNREAAANFFGIDPQLVGVPVRTGSVKTGIAAKGEDR